MEIPDSKQKRKELKDTHLLGLCSSSNVVVQVCKDNLDTSKTMWCSTEYVKQAKGMEFTPNSTPNSRN